MFEFENCYKTLKARRMPDGRTDYCEAWEPVTEQDRDRFRANGEKPEIRRCVSHKGRFQNLFNDEYHTETVWRPIGASDDPRDQDSDIRTNGVLSGKNGGIKFDPEKVVHILAAGLLDGAILTDMIQKPERFLKEWLALIWLLDGETINGERVKLNATMPEELRDIAPEILDIARAERETDKVFTDLIAAYTTK